MIYKQIGVLKKLQVNASLERMAQYSLKLEDEELSLNPMVGDYIRIRFLGKLACVNCGKDIRKTFAQGFCYTCFRSIPQADLCLVRPEICHFHKGTCRDPEWGKKNCFINHTVYLANSSGLKVGITRSQNEQTRWLDQGAIQAIAIARVSKRIQAGIMEAEIRKHVSDRTNWRLLLRQDTEPLDLCAKRDELLSYLPDDLVYDGLSEETLQIFHYPVIAYPKKIQTFDFLKEPIIEGDLMGIKGQYLIFEKGVLNVRKFTGYSVEFSSRK